MYRELLVYLKQLDLNPRCRQSVVVVVARQAVLGDLLQDRHEARHEVLEARSILIYQERRHGTVTILRLSCVERAKVERLFGFTNIKLVLQNHVQAHKKDFKELQSYQ